MDGTVPSQRSDAEILAILRELERGGQVFFVHNRVQTIEHKAAELRDKLLELEKEELKLRGD